MPRRISRRRSRSTAAIRTCSAPTRIFFSIGSALQDVVDLLRNETTNDALLLRLVLAEATLAGRTPNAQASFTAHRDELAARFDAARRRGDTVHRREEARYALAIEGDVRRALALALANWAVQREPADLRLLAEAARSAADDAALAMVDRWIEAHRLEDVTLAAIRGRAR